MRIRRYTKDDFKEISSWWEQAQESAPPESLMPLESTFILEHESTPMLCISAYLTNTPEVAYLENFIGNPKMKGPLRRAGSKELVDFVTQWAKEQGYKRLLCLAHKEPLKEWYAKLGWEKTSDTLASFVRVT